MRAHTCVLYCWRVDLLAHQAVLSGLRADGGDVKLEQLERLNVAQLAQSSFDEVRMLRMEPTLCAVHVSLALSVVSLHQRGVPANH